MYGYACSCGELLLTAPSKLLGLLNCEACSPYSGPASDSGHWPWVCAAQGGLPAGDEHFYCVCSITAATFLGIGSRCKGKKSYVAGVLPQRLTRRGHGKCLASTSVRCVAGGRLQWAAAALIVGKTRKNRRGKSQFGIFKKAHHFETRRVAVGGNCAVSWRLAPVVTACSARLSRKPRVSCRGVGPSSYPPRGSEIGGRLRRGSDIRNVHYESIERSFFFNGSDDVIPPQCGHEIDKVWFRKRSISGAVTGVWLRAASKPATLYAPSAVCVPSWQPGEGGEDSGEDDGKAASRASS